MRKGMVEVHQLTVMVFMFTIGSSILLIPSLLASGAAQDAWIAGILAMLFGIGLAMFYGRLALKFGESTFNQFCEEMLGAWLGRVVALLYVGHFLLLGTLVLRNIGDFFATQILPDTPIQIILLLFMLVVVFGLRYEFPTIARTSIVLFQWVVILFLALVLLLLPKVEVVYMKPIFEVSWGTLLRTAYPFVGTPFLELVIFLAAMPFVRNRKKAAQAYWVGTLMGGVVLVSITLLSVLVLGPIVSANKVYPSYTLAKKISIGNIIERVEALMAALWIISIFMKISICFKVSTEVLRDALRLQEVRPLILPLAMIMICMSLVTYPDIVYSTRFIHIYWTPYAATFGVLLPLVLYVTALIRQRNR